MSTYKVDAKGSAPAAVFEITVAKTMRRTEMAIKFGRSIRIARPQ